MHGVFEWIAQLLPFSSTESDSTVELKKLLYKLVRK